MTLLPKLLLIFVGTPLLELALLIWIGNTLGFWYTMAAVIVTGVLGATLAKLEGLRVVHQIRSELLQGRMPVGRLLDGFLVLVGGITLLTPGFLTDLLGFLLLVPVTRAGFKHFLRRRLERMAQTRSVEFTMLLD